MTRADEHPLKRTLVAQIPKGPLRGPASSGTGPDAAAALARADDRVAHLGGAVAVLEGRAVRSDVRVLRDRAKEVERLVGERVAPADDVARRPPEIPERVVRLRDEHRLEASRPVAVGPEDLKLVQPLHVERQRALGAVDLPLERVPPAEREPRCLDRPDGPALELDRGLERVVDAPARQEGADEPGDGRDLADEEPRQVDDVGAEVAERAGPRLVRLEAPGVQRGIVAPVLEVAPAEVADLAELAGVDQLARQPHRRHEAVVEAAQVLDAGGRHALPDLVALGGVAAERLLAEHVLARLGRGDRRLGVQRVGAAVVEEADRRVADEVPPVGRPALVAVPGGGRRDRFLVAARQRDEPRLEGALERADRPERA